jgi:uncharacterized protein involved in exopolysaccharide biosynthesis
VESDVKTFSDYLAIMMRRKKLILLLATGVILAGVIIAYSITPIYVSSATIRIEQQSISSEFVQPAVTGYVDEQIQEIRQRVMSASKLSALIDEYDLYPDLSNSDQSHIAIERIRLATILEPEYAEVFNASTGRSSLVTIGFKIFFENSDPAKTQAIASEIANLYVTENERGRSAQVEETISFLEKDLESARQDVDESSAELAEFRERHVGNLPDMSDFNLQAMERTERQIDAIDAQIRDARDRKQILEGELVDPTNRATTYDINGEPIVGTAQRLAELQRERIRLASIYSAQHPDIVKIDKEIEILAGGSSGGGIGVSELQAQLQNTRAQLDEARQRYGEDHPDVKRLVRSVETLQQQVNDSLRQPRQSASIASQDPVVRQIQLRIQAQENDIRTFQNRRAELVMKMDDYEEKMARMPQIERQYAVLTRSNEAAVARFNGTRDKLSEARTAGKLEAEGAGDQFILTDPPQLPLSPERPNRTSILIITIFLALVIGIAAAIVTDSMDQTVQDTRDLFRISNAPPIAVIPYLETPRERRSRVTANIATSGLVAACMVLAIVISRTMG